MKATVVMRKFGSVRRTARERTDECEDTDQPAHPAKEKAL